MTNELAIQKTQELSLSQIWNDSQSLKDIRDLFAPKLTAIEFQGFINMGKATRLNPFLREIWAIKYDGNKPAQYFIGRDGYRKTAQQQPDYDYHRVESVYSKDFFESHNGEINHKYTFGNRGDLLGAYCVVKRKSSSKEIFVSVQLKEYNKKQSCWNTHEETMIKKVAEAQGLKAAFQEVFSGMNSEYEEGLINEFEEKKISKQAEKANDLLAKRGKTNEARNADIETNDNSMHTVIDGVTGELLNKNGSSKQKAANANANDGLAGKSEKDNSTANAQDAYSKVTEQQLDVIDCLLHDKGLDKARQLKALDHFNVVSFADLSEMQGEEMIAILNKMESKV